MGCGGVGGSRVPEIQIEAVVGHRRDVEARIRLDNGAQDVMESESAFEHGGFLSRMQTTLVQCELGAGDMIPQMVGCDAIRIQIRWWLKIFEYDLVLLSSNSIVPLSLYTLDSQRRFFPSLCFLASCTPGR